MPRWSKRLRCFSSTGVRTVPVADIMKPSISSLVGRRALTSPDGPFRWWGHLFQSDEPGFFKPPSRFARAFSAWWILWAARRRGRRRPVLGRLVRGVNRVDETIQRGGPDKSPAADHQRFELRPSNAASSPSKERRRVRLTGQHPSGFSERNRIAVGDQVSGHGLSIAIHANVRRTAIGPQKCRPPRAETGKSPGGDLNSPPSPPSGATALGAFERRRKLLGFSALGCEGQPYNWLPGGDRQEQIMTARNGQSFRQVSGRRP